MKEPLIFLVLVDVCCFWVTASSVRRLPPQVRPLPPMPDIDLDLNDLPELPIAPQGKNTQIEKFHIKSDIRYRFSTTQIQSVVRNIANASQEIKFDVTLPKEAFIVKFSMTIDGKVYDGEVKEKTEAKKQYQAAVDRGESAGHIRQTPRHSNLFEVSVNIHKGSAVTFNLTYQEILHRKLGVYEQEIHINPEQPVKDFKVEVFIQENKPLLFVRTPALRNDSLLSNSVEDENELTIVDRPSPNTAYILYKPTTNEWKDVEGTIRFVVQYDVEHSTKGDVLAVDGYFVHFFSPDLPPMPKDIIFVLDVSGSMYGRKLKQLQNAMLSILGDIQEQDRFNIFTFSSNVHKWQQGLKEASADVIRQAKSFVKQMQSDGMTNINSALQTAITELRSRGDKARVPMIFFLTDGVPTAGTTNSKKIAANVLDQNAGVAAIFGLAFGSSADYDSLKTICAQNSGFARKIYEASDASLQVATLYQEISAVVMTDITIDYLPSTEDEYSITDTDFPVVFNGSEIIICGFLAPNTRKFELEISGKQKSGDVEYVIEIDDVNEIVIDANKTENSFFTVPRDYAGIVEKMWAFTTIKQLLKEKEKHMGDEEKVKELKTKILDMSLQYRFVTPLTSMVVTKPETEGEQMESGLEDVDEKIGPIPSASSLASAGSSRNPTSQLASSYSSGKLMSGRRHGLPPLHSSFSPDADDADQDYAFNLGAPVIDPMPKPKQRPVYHKARGGPRRHSRKNKARGRKNKKRKGWKRKQNKVEAALMSIFVHSQNVTMCLGTSAMKPGTYTILQTSNGTSLVLSLKRFGKKSKVDKQTYKSRFNALVIRGSGHETVVVDKGRKNISAFNESGIVGNITSQPVANSTMSLYHLDLVLSANHQYTALIGHLLHPVTKKHRKWTNNWKMAAVCKDRQADIGGEISPNMGKKYKVRNKKKTKKHGRRRPRKMQ